VAEALEAVNPAARLIVLSAQASTFLCPPGLESMLLDEIADQLELSLYKVQTHRRNLSQKQGMKGTESAHLDGTIGGAIGGFMPPWVEAASPGPMTATSFNVQNLRGQALLFRCTQTGFVTTASALSRYQGQ